MTSLLLALALTAQTPTVDWDTLGGVSWDTLVGTAELSTPTEPVPPTTEPTLPADTAPAPVETAGACSYAEAYRQYLSGRNMVVFLTADWCGPCQALKPYAPTLSRLGALTFLDIDRYPLLSRKIAGLPSDDPRLLVPTVVVYQPGQAPRRYIGTAIYQLLNIPR
jgi:thiol-disulfide isomerase/thioredoxin